MAGKSKCRRLKTQLDNNSRLEERVYSNKLGGAKGHWRLRGCSVTAENLRLQSLIGDLIWVSTRGDVLEITLCLLGTRYFCVISPHTSIIIPGVWVGDAKATTEGG